MSIEMASKVEGETTKNVDGVGYPHDDMIVEAIPKENLGDHDLRSTNRASMSVSMSHFASSRGVNEQASLRWENIRFSTMIKDKAKSTFFKTEYQRKDILQGLSGEVSTGEMLAILGPTGCGKSSFLNILSARMPTAAAKFTSVSGSITVNGKLRNDHDFRMISAYLLQDDYMHMYPHLTVYETLLLSAHFFLPESMNLEDKTSLVESIISDLSLKKARDTIIGNDKVRGISGGERRRTSIAVQMLTDPLILFLDEPTSGLDSFQAQSVMESMKLLADLGRLVVSVIHQPRSSIFNMFDKLLLLSEGKTMYMGPASTAVEFFQSIGYICPENFNPSDFFLDILSPDARSKELDEETHHRINLIAEAWTAKSSQQRFLASEESKGNGSDIDEPGKEIKRIGDEISYYKSIRNFSLLCWRTWSEQSRDINSLRLKFIMTCFFSLLLGGIYNNIGNDQKSIQNRIGLLFFITINQSFSTCAAVFNAFPKEKFIVNRERSGRAYNTISYFAAKVIVEIPLNVSPAILYSLILYWIVGLNPEPARVIIFILILMMTSLTAVSYGLAISSLVPTVEAANALGTPLLVIGILFGGFYISVGNLPIVANWIPYFSFLRWGFEALTINEFEGLTFKCNNDQSVATGTSGCIKTGEQELQILTFDKRSTDDAIFGLAMVFIGFLFVTYMFLLKGKQHYLEIGHTGYVYASKFSRESSRIKYDMIQGNDEREPNKESNQDSNSIETHPRTQSKLVEMEKVYDDQ